MGASNARQRPNQKRLTKVGDEGQCFLINFCCAVLKPNITAVCLSDGANGLKLHDTEITLLTISQHSPNPQLLSPQ
jgi:hypothetical protein